MDKQLAISMCSSRNIAALVGFLGIENGTPLKWKENDKLMLIRYLQFMSRLYKWTVLQKVNLNDSNCDELKKEMKFIEKLFEMNDERCQEMGSKAQSYNKVHPATKKIILGTCKSLLQLVEKLGSFRPYRLSNSQ